VPPSLNSTGEASATPQGASLRIVPVPAFHVSLSVSCAGAPDTYWGVAATKPTDAPVKANAVTVQRAASLCAFFTSLPFSRPSVRR
jgi:hypothetical protein